MSKALDDWINNQTDEDYSKLASLHAKVKQAQGKSKGKHKTDLAVVDNVLDHLLTSGVYPTGPELDAVDFNTLV
jgi:hypothetical protein